MTSSVLIYAPRVLPRSQTFIAAQARALRRWQPALVGRQLEVDGLDVADLVSSDASRMIGTSGAWHRRVTRRVPVIPWAVDRAKPALIHAHFLTGGIDVVTSLRPLPCPLVVTAHGFDATWYGSPFETRRPRQWVFGLMRRRLLRERVHFIAVSRFVRDQLVGLGAPAERVVVHHTGVDTSFFSPTVGSRGRGILFVGRLVPKKGVDDLLMAVALLKAEGTEVAVTIIGDGPERPRIERVIADERLQVQVLGAQPVSAVRDAMRSAAVLCGPSRTDQTGDREGFGMVFAEAQAVGLPVVATASGGIPDAIDDEVTGLLVPERDHRALANALHRCLTDDELRARLRAAARPRAVRSFDLTTQSAKLEDLYDEWSISRTPRPSTDASGRMQ